MAVHLRWVIIILLLFSTRKIFPKMYNQIDGYKTKEALLDAIITPVNDGRIKCCMYCTSVSDCLSASFNKHNGTCILSSAPIMEGSFYENRTNWELWYQTNPEWTLVFRGMAKNGKDMAQSWNNGSSNCLTEYGSTCTDHYRSDLIDRWEELNIQEVKVEIYKDNQKVAFLRFNGVGTNKMNWFRPKIMITSSWSEVTSTAKYNIFGIYGHKQVSRSFFINKEYAGCQGDYGWFVVMDVTYAGRGNCYSDRHVSYPAILYSTNPNGTSWNVKREFDLADRMYIYIRT